MSHLYVTQEHEPGYPVNSTIGVYTSLLSALVNTVKAYESGILSEFDVSINTYVPDTEVTFVNTHRSINAVVVTDQNTGCDETAVELNVYLSKEIENTTEIINDLCKATGFLCRIFFIHCDPPSDQYSDIYTIVKDKQSKG